MFATASPRTRAHKFLVSDLELGFPRTALLANLNTVSLGRYINRTVRKGKSNAAPEHAEHVLVSDLDARWPAIAQGCGVERNVPATFELTLTRSPCDMDGHTCGSLLQSFIDRKRADGYQLTLHLRLMSLHKGSIDAKAVLAALRARGAKLSAVTVEQLLSEGLVQEDGPEIVDNEMVVAKDGETKRPLGGAVAELQATLDEVEREGKTGA